jgi:hypothetical protein
LGIWCGSWDSELDPSWTGAGDGDGGLVGWICGGVVEEAGFAGVGGSDGVGVFWGMVGGRRRGRRGREEKGRRGLGGEEGGRRGREDGYQVSVVFGE